MHVKLELRIRDKKLSFLFVLWFLLDKMLAHPDISNCTVFSLRISLTVCSSYNSVKNLNYHLNITCHIVMVAN